VAIILVVPFICLFWEAELPKGKTQTNRSLIFDSNKQLFNGIVILIAFFSNYYCYFHAYKLTWVSMCFQGK